MATDHLHERLEDLIDLLREGKKELRDDMKGIHERLDVLNGRTRTVEQKVAVLEARVVPSRKEKVQQASWVAGVSAAAVAIAEVVKVLIR